MSHEYSRRHVEVDVVIPTRDRPAQLTTSLSALARQRGDGFGVIVVDDGGKSRAEDLLPDGLRNCLAIRFVRNDVSIGAGASRNRGVEMSEAPYVVFLDDDCVASPDLLSRHRAALAGGDHVVSLGPIISPPGQRLSAWTHWDADRLEREYARLMRGEISPGWAHLYTGNVGIRRADFRAVGGFDSRFARQEDIELGYRLGRLGCRFEFDALAVVFHDSDRSLRTWRRIPAASARFDVLMDQLIPESHRVAAVREGLCAKHWALRLTRRLARPPLTRRCAVTGAIGAGCILHAVHADRAALSAFSVVWDLTYSQALAEAVGASTAGGRPRNGSQQ